MASGKWNQPAATHKNKTNQYSEFQIWFAGCIQYCIDNPNELWDGHNWDIKNTGVWQKYFNQEMTEEMAVKAHFKYKDSLN